MSKARTILYYILSAITAVLNPIVWWIFQRIYGAKGRSVSKVTNPLLLQSATQLAKKIRTQQVSGEQSYLYPEVVLDSL
jgi:fatty acid amide hydrolase 2